MSWWYVGRRRAPLRVMVSLSNNEIGSLFLLTIQDVLLRGITTEIVVPFAHAC